MNSRKSWAAAAGLALGALTLLAAAPVIAQPTAPAVDPAALQILKKMTDFMDGLPQFSVNSQNVLEELHSSGHRVDYVMAATVTVKRPNKLRAVRIGDLMNQSFFYDGKSLTLSNPLEKVYASQPAPPTVEGMINLARETVGIVLPAADIVYRGAYPLLTKDLTLAVVVDKALIGGVRCDHLLFSHPGADFQVWVEEGAKPWPRRYVVTDTSSPARLSVTSFFSDWNESPAADDAQFAFVPPAGTQEIRWIPYETGGKSDR